MTLTDTKNTAADGVPALNPDQDPSNEHSPLIRPPPAPRQKHIWLPRRSLLILAEEARYSWTHYIAPRTYDKVEGVGLIKRQRRISLTFREAKIDPSVPPPAPLLA
eukprot:gene3785-4718_t